MPVTKPLKDKFITVRVDATTYSLFTRKSYKFGGNSIVIREFVNAFLKNRVTIKPDPTKETLCHE